MRQASVREYFAVGHYNAFIGGREHRYRGDICICRPQSRPAAPRHDDSDYGERKASAGESCALLFVHERREVALAAGPNGIRGTTCTMLADAGCTPSEIAAYLGWTPKTVMEMLARYQAMTAAQSDSAVAKLEARRAE